MKLKHILPYILLAVLMFFLIKGNDRTKTIVEVPSKENDYVVEDPKPVIKYDTIFKDSIVKVKNPVNQELLKKYEDAQSEIERLSIYKGAITERTYKEVYKDNYQDITVTSEVIGELTRQELSYKTKEQVIEVEDPSEGLYLGAGVQFNHTRLSIPNPEVNISYLKNKQMYTLGINQKEIRINYKLKIF
jgi:hypothetical protein